MKFRDVRHIVHMAIIVVVVIVGFLIARYATVPRSFGQYGHYRAASIEERMSLPVILQGAQSCRECHEEAIERKGQPTMWLGYQAWREGGHSSNTCENCHSNCKEHIELRRAQPDVKKDVITINRSRQHCLMCHTALAARPKKFKLYDAETHAGYYEAMEFEEDVSCTKCHVPHSPDTFPETPD